MNRDRLEGNWKQVKGRVREQWGKLTNDDLDEIRGRMETLVGKVQERYGKEKDEANREVGTWLDNIEEPEREPSRR